MSTRAIIGFKNPDGSIIGAWQWNDGGTITRKLNSHFNTIERAKKLINFGMWSSMFTTAEVDEFEDWLMKTSGKTSDELQPPVQYTYVCGVYLRQHENEWKQKPKLYRNYADMAGQDINHTYLFDTKTNRWVKDKDIDV